jgi:hypothetical protein
MPAFAASARRKVTLSEGGIFDSRPTTPRASGVRIARSAHLIAFASSSGVVPVDPERSRAWHTLSKSLLTGLHAMATSARATAAEVRMTARVSGTPFEACALTPDV